MIFSQKNHDFGFLYQNKVYLCSISSW